MIYVHMKKLLPPVMAALLLASCGNNTLGTSEGAVSQEVTVTPKNHWISIVATK